MRFIGKFFLIAVVCLCGAALPARRESRAAELESDAEVKGLWLTAPRFPDDAESVGFEADDEGEVTYTRALDGGLTFLIRRSPSGDTKTPEEIKEMIERYVEDSGGDADAIEFDMSAAKIAERLSYPSMLAAYATGGDEGPKWGAFMCVFTDEFTFVVHLEMPEDAVGAYKNQMESWFSTAELVDGGGADDVVKEDAPDANVKGLWLTAPAFPKSAKPVELYAPDGGMTAHYIRALDGCLFTIRRLFYGETKTPEEMREEKEAVKKRVEESFKENGGDPDDIEFDMSAEEFAEILGYPCMVAKHEADEGESLVMSLHVFTEECSFEVQLALKSESADKYEDQIEGWFRNLKFVNAEPAAGGGEDESAADDGPVAAVYTSEDFNGEAWIIDKPGGYDLGKDFELPNDSVCSVRVRPGYKVTLYRDSGFGGEGLENDRDSDRLGEWNRVTSSLKVEKADAGDTEKWLKALEEAAPGHAKLAKGGEELAKAVERHAERIEKYHDAPWYGSTTDGERVEMAGELLEIFGDCGADVDGWTPNSFAQQINNFYDWLPGSVWRIACRILNVDPDAFE